MKPRRPVASRPLPMEIDASRRPPLGMPPEVFLRDYWQKRPLLIRNAFPGFESPIAPEDLAGLACEEAALSRIVLHDRARDAWTLRTGPFSEDEFPDMPQQDWTLLVQDVDKWDADIAALLQRFDFLPRWRVDDVMVSFAAPGGSVGAHVDQYDVFLLQAQGRRRWQIDASVCELLADPRTHAGELQRRLAFRDDVELKLLREFTPSHDWVLEPGDMLYLPPGVPHHGVAEDACLTFSVGMRAPSAAELLGDFVDTLAADADEALRYRDPDLTPPADPFEIDAGAMDRVVEALNMLRMNDPQRLGDWFGRFITTYRSGGVVTAGPVTPERDEVEAAVAGGMSLVRHPFSRMAWRRAARGARLYAGGLEFSMGIADARRLAAADTMDAAGVRALGAQGREALYELVRAGHFQPARDDAEDDDA